MICAWQSLLNLLPIWIRENVDKLGRNRLQEVRFRLNHPPILNMGNESIALSRVISAEDMHFCINAASKYSPWTAGTALNGYITAPGGHRIGICGKASNSAGSITGTEGLTSICIRVARDFPGIATSALELDVSALIIGCPGSGKTTLLRDIIRQRSNASDDAIAVVDEREEIFPRANGSFCFPVGKNTDVLSGVKKPKGIDMVLRTMGPGTIAIDEITAYEDCHALLQAGWCGVKLLATAHAGHKEELLHRPIYRPILESHIFDTVIILKRDKSWHAEKLI